MALTSGSICACYEEKVQFMELPMGSLFQLLRLKIFLLHSRETSSSASTVVVDHTTSPRNPQSHSSSVRRGSSQTRWQETISSASLPFTRPTSVSSTIKPRPHYFKFQLFPGKFMKIKFDRLALLALMDRYKFPTLLLTEITTRSHQ